jgi:hypothetical protein
MVSLCSQLTADGERVELLQFRRGVDIREEIVHLDVQTHDDHQTESSTDRLLLVINVNSSRLLVSEERLF